MSKHTADQIVASLLEYGIDPSAPPPGHPDDPWRQSTGPLPPMQFSARPSPDDEARADMAALAAEEEDPLAPAPPEEMPPGMMDKLKKQFRAGGQHRSRFQWKPPTTEALLHELGGYYCFTCKEPTTVKEGKGRKNVCAKCGAEINYGKHGKNPVPKK